MRRITADLVLLPGVGLASGVILSVGEGVGEGCVGEILGVARGVDSVRKDGMEGVEHYSGVLIPGMVNAHCHLELSYLLGAVSEGGGLVEFIREIMAVRGNFSMEEQVDRAVVEDRKMWGEGVQGVCDISNGTASFRAKEGSLIEYYTYAEFFNMPSKEQLEGYYAGATGHVAVARDMNLKISPTPHSNYMVGDLLFKRGVGDAERLSIHFMETLSEVEYFDKKGLMYDFVNEDGMTPDFLHYGGHAERLIGALPKDIPLLLVHNTMITREQVEMLVGYFTDLTFVVCPRSNYYIERSFPPVMMLRDMGVNVAIGTDSLTSNHSLSMALELDWMLRHNPELPIHTALEWATMGGVKGLGMTQTMGSFEVGKTPGVVLIEGLDTKSMKLTETPLSSRRII